MVDPQLSGRRGTAGRSPAAASTHTGLAGRRDDARYFPGVLLYQSHEDAASAKQFRRYLELVGEDEDAQPPYRAPLVRQAKIQLDR